MKDFDQKLFKLHQHWLIADSVKEALRAYQNSSSSLTVDLPEKLLSLGRTHSVFDVQKVFYALVYVVVEEYQALNYRDAQIDALLAERDKVETLKRFRNAIFHVQKPLISPKELDFLEADNDGSWIKNLHYAMNSFFVDRLDLMEFIEKYQKKNSCTKTEPDC
ncbi:hypothetical protein GQF03_07770 [Sneathiella chungangensis]|uniref:Uncharacterized protein n=1 Tax=Sneathiella chungangensis TaxID=1418234 RepID=A0A845MDU2_9PROT|nr:hypothetical protein [Sneathiella chungangensis]MZR22223.1 hypothetical protein [Sneathiella chungangensis]